MLGGGGGVGARMVSLVWGLDGEVPAGERVRGGRGRVVLFRVLGQGGKGIEGKGGEGLSVWSLGEGFSSCLLFLKHGEGCVMYKRSRGGKRRVRGLEGAGLR